MSYASYLAQGRQEYCLTWAAGSVGGRREVTMGMGSSSDAFGASQY